MFELILLVATMSPIKVTLYVPYTEITVVGVYNPNNTPTAYAVAKDITIVVSK